MGVKYTVPGIPLADVWRLYNGSQLPPEVIAHEEDRELQVFHADLFTQITKDTKA